MEHPINNCGKKGSGFRVHLNPKSMQDNGVTGCFMEFWAIILPAFGVQVGKILGSFYEITQHDPHPWILEPRAPSASRL